MIKVISFDIGNTLYLCKYSSMKMDIISNKYNIPKKKVMEAYKKTFQVLNEDFNIICKSFFELLNIEFNEKNLNYLKKIFISKDKKRFYIDNKIVDLLKMLKENNFTLITFSNNCKYNHIENEIIDKYFDYKFNSFEMGYTKNSSKSFDYITKELNVARNEILHIGDNYNSDYVKPIENGLNAVLYNNNEYDCIKLENIYDLVKIINGSSKNLVILKEYTYLYKIIYNMEKTRLSYIFNNSDIIIYHVGSTSIKGLMAKPIIDIAVLVNKLNDILKYIDKMRQLGYHFRDDNGAKGEYLFYRGENDNRYCYVHVVEKNSTRCKNFLYFKNYLIKHKECIKEYNDLKIQLCAKYKNKRKKYTASKNYFIQDVIKKYENILLKGRDLDE